MSAVGFLDRLGVLGVMLRVEGDRLRVLSAEPLPAELLDELRARKGELWPFVDGSLCRYCGRGPLDWRAPGLAVALGDGSSAHATCRNRWLAEPEPREAPRPGQQRPQRVAP